MKVLVADNQGVCVQGRVRGRGKQPRLALIDDLGQWAIERAEALREPRV
jgi:hypothetical protein